MVAVNNNIRVSKSRLNKPLMHRVHMASEPCRDFLLISTAFVNIASQSAHKPELKRSLDKDPSSAQLVQLFPIQREQPFNNDRGARRDLFPEHGPGVFCEIVNRLFNRLPVQKHRKLFDHQHMVNRIRRVKIDLLPLFKGEVVQRSVIIVNPNYHAVRRRRQCIR